MKNNFIEILIRMYPQQTHFIQFPSAENVINCCSLRLLSMNPEYTHLVNTISDFKHIYNRY